MNTVAVIPIKEITIDGIKLYPARQREDTVFPCTGCYLQSRQCWKYEDVDIDCEPLDGHSYIYVRKD